MNPDFAQLYRQLDIEPDCSLEEFKHAYRRLVARWHPDRHGGGDGTGDRGAPALADLTPLYNTALRFHRRYGRLPGARSRRLKASAPQVALLPVAARPDPRALEREGSGYRRWLLVGLLVAAVLVLMFWKAPSPDMHADIQVSPSMEMDAPRNTTAPNLPDHLQQGMDAAIVRSIQGEPVKVRDDQWEYGPSWLRFEKGVLVDWYSSPLYRLKTETPTPPSPEPDNGG